MSLFQPDPYLHVQLKMAMEQMNHKPAVLQKDLVKWAKHFWAQQNIIYQ